MNVFIKPGEREHGGRSMSQTFTSSPAAVAFPMDVHARTVDRSVRAWRAARIAAGVGLVTGGLSLPVVALLDLRENGAEVGLLWVQVLGHGERGGGGGRIL